MLITTRLTLGEQTALLFICHLKNTENPQNDTLLGLPLVAKTVKKSPANAGDTGLMPGLGTSSGEGIGNPLQYSCLENPMDRGAWWATVYGVAKE